MGCLFCKDYFKQNEKKEERENYKNDIEKKEIPITKNQVISKNDLSKNDLYGFINKENNCYMNSSLQLLTRINELKNNIVCYKENEICKDSITNGKLIIEFKKILNYIKNKVDNINPKELKKVMGEIDERYKYNNQEDANEFISNFLDGLLDETANKNNNVQKLTIKKKEEKEAYDKFYNRFYKQIGNSFLLDLFYGILRTEKKCKNCKEIILIKYNSYNMIELPLYNLVVNSKKKSLELKDILDDYIKPYNISNSSCKKCKKNNITEQTKIYTLPQYLIIFFGRTIGEKYIDNTISYDEEIDLKDY
jgi:ubiquitin C-terminal hydrolase